MGVEEKFERKNLSFPLHEGARIYLDRDEPGHFERYAELFGVVFSIILTLVSGLISLSKWQSQKKKDRADIFYKDLIEAKNAIRKITSPKEGLKNYDWFRTLKTKLSKCLSMKSSKQMKALGFIWSCQKRR